MEVLSAGTPNGDALSQPAQSADPVQVLEHIARLIEANLGAARRELETVGSLLSSAKHADSLERCDRFASEPQLTLYAQKDIREEKVNGHSDGDGEYFPHRAGPA